MKYAKLCEKNYHQMNMFMDVSLLLLLNREPAHGYALLDQLAHFGFDVEKLNIGTLYKKLRKLEKDALVTSRWEQGEQGPRRRIYNITNMGKGELEDWIIVMKLRKERMEGLIYSYENEF